MIALEVLLLSASTELKIGELLKEARHCKGGLFREMQVLKQVLIR
ncbi:hypothetical protein [Niabella ginsenosidivorans]|nr:hypothetical protein [Niabella ginsenosidivorans]